MPVGNVRNAHGRIGRVDVLPAFAAGAVGIDADVFRLDDDIDAVVDFRRDEDAGKRRMPPLRLIERRDAHQAMDADFTLAEVQKHIRRSP